VNYCDVFRLNLLIKSVPLNSLVLIMYMIAFKGLRDRRPVSFYGLRRMVYGKSDGFCVGARRITLPPELSD
jgi:hypothetical protein